MRIAFVTFTSILFLLVLSTPVRAADCNIYGPQYSVPTGYGASYNVFNTSQMMISIGCNEDESITVTTGNNDPLTYIYKEGYRYDAAAQSWVNFTYTCDNMVADAWCVGQVSKNLTNVPTADANFLVSYTCQWSGSKWNCGCSNTSCSSPAWQLQGWRVAPPSGGGTIDPNAEGVIFYHDFENESLHTYTSEDARNTWDAPIAVVLDGGISVVNDPDPSGSHGKVMRGFYAANTYGYAGGSGGQMLKNLAGYNELYVSVDVYFKSGAEFVKGGKLPGGPRSVDWISNQQTCKVRPNGTDYWTAGPTWHAGGELKAYVYHMHQPNLCGHSISWNDGADGKKTYFTPGKWHRVEMRIVVNDPGVSNGIVQGWFDGEQRLDNRNFVFRMPGGEHLKIGQYFINTFYGGGDSSFAPSKDQHIYFDNFVISTKPITH